MMALGLVTIAALTAGAVYFGLTAELFNILWPAAAIGAVIGFVGFLLPD